MVLKGTTTCRKANPTSITLFWAIIQSKTILMGNGKSLPNWHKVSGTQGGLVLEICCGA